MSHGGRESSELLAQARHRSRWAVVLACMGAALALIVLAGCGGDSSSSDTGTSASGKDPIVIGMPIGLTGFMRDAADGPVLAGSEFAVEDINKKGGVLGRPLKIITADHKSDINLVRATALDVLSKHPDFLQTSCDYNFGGPQAQAANQQGILAIGCAGATAFGKQGIGPLTFNTWHGNPTEAAALAEFANKKGFKSAYLMVDQTLDYTKEVCNLFDKRFTELGGTVVGQDKYQNDDQSFNAQVTRLREQADNVDVIVICGIVPGGPSLIKAIRAAGIDTPIIGSGGGFDGDFWTKQVPDMGTFYTNSVGSISGDSPVAEQNDLVKRNIAKYGKPPLLGHIFIGYSGIQLLAKAIEKAGSTDSEKVKAAMESFKDVPTVAGPTTYTPECHIPVGRELQITTREDGKMKYLETIKPEKVPPAPC